MWFLQSITMNDINFLKNQNNTRTNHSKWDEYFNLDIGRKVLSFHKTIPEYKPTPLHSLEQLSTSLGLQNIYVKDESSRFNLNAFKGLGGSWSIANYLKARFKLPDSFSFSDLTQTEIAESISNITFITATDGNHGRGIAWMSNLIGAKCQVFLPKGTVRERLENIQKLGAEATITNFNYDDTVRYAQTIARDNNMPFMQDTVVGDEIQIPLWVMQGYLTMGMEIKNAITEPPTHIFLQAGVGSTAAALTSFFRNIYGEKVKIGILESQNCDCIYKTAEANDGKLRITSGDFYTMMAGLSCGEINPIAWDILNEEADCFFGISDDIAALGMRALGRPIENDSVIVSGESGASTTGLAIALLKKDAYQDIKNAIELNSNSRILCISTEGATDLENYQRIVH